MKRTLAIRTLNRDGKVLFARPGGLLSGEVDLIEANVGIGGSVSAISESILSPLR